MGEGDDQEPVFAAVLGGGDVYSGSVCCNFLTGSFRI